MAVSKLILELTAIKSNALMITKIMALFGEIFPAGISREAVRGLSRSIFQSVQRLKPIATLRAKTIQPIICSSKIQLNSLSVLLSANTNAISANGMANIVWENFTSPM